MTVREAIEKTDELYPNVFSFSQKVFFLEQLDGKVFFEFLSNYEGAPESFEGDYIYHTDKTLLIPVPYDDIYIKYLVMQFDILGSDITRYQNTSALFNKEYLDFICAYNRSHVIKSAKINVSGVCI